MSKRGERRVCGVGKGGGGGRVDDRKRQVVTRHRNSSSGTDGRLPLPSRTFAFSLLSCLHPSSLSQLTISLNFSFFFKQKIRRGETVCNCSSSFNAKQRNLMPNARSLMASYRQHFGRFRHLQLCNSSATHHVVDSIL